MSQPLPAVAEDPNVILSALARAAAQLAAQEQIRRQEAGPLDRAAIEAIIEECVRATFLRFGIDLTDSASVEDFRDTIKHARRSRQRWDKAGTTIVGGLVGSAVAGITGLVMKFLASGGAK